MVAGGIEAPIIPVGLGGFVACRALSTRNDDPQTASRPWDKDREGFVMGEGGGVLVSGKCYEPCVMSLVKVGYLWGRIAEQGYVWALILMAPNREQALG